MDGTNEQTSSVPTTVVSSTISETDTLLEAQTSVDEVRCFKGNRILPTDGTHPEMARVQRRVYRQRWIVLAVVVLLNLVNCITWIAFAPVGNYVDAFYDFTEAALSFKLIYMLVTVPVGIFAMYVSRFFGLRTAILIVAWSNALGVGVRLASSFASKKMMFLVGMTGQAIAAIAFPFTLFLPTKVAGSWFGANQRGLATTIGVMANPLGVILSNRISPHFVKKPNHVLYLNILAAILSTVVCIMATIGVTRSKPQTPPTSSADRVQPPFSELLGVVAAGIGMFNCLYTILPRLLCPNGHEYWLSDFCGTTILTGGLVGATTSGIFVDRTRQYTETMKVSMVLAVAFGLTFLQLSQIRHIPYFILLACFFFGVMGLAMYSVGLEMSAECTFPITETTSSGLIVLCGQVMTVISKLVMFLVPNPPADTSAEACSNPLKAQNMRNLIKVVSAFAVLMALFLLVAFKPIYKRMNSEKKLIAADTTIQNAIPPTA